MFKKIKVWLIDRKNRLNKKRNKQNSQQKEKVAKDLLELAGMAKVEEAEIDAHYREYADRHNGQCPKCGAKDPLDIVDKIRQVQGEGYVRGEFFLGHGGVYGRTTVDTNEVNHCNKCGNEWKKEHRVFTTHRKVISSWLNDIKVYSEDSQCYAKRTIEKLKKFHAESIYALINEAEDDSLYLRTKETLTLPTLRKYFKSVFDE